MTIKNIPEVDYYSLGNPNDIYISNSALKEIDPLSGGHPRKFLNFFTDEKERKTSKQIENGNTIHQFCESTSNFAVADVTKPTEKAGEIADKIIEIALKQIKYPDVTINMNSSLDVMNLFEDARKEIDYYKSRETASAFKTFATKEALEYITFAFLNKDKIILTKDQGEMMTKVSDNLRKHPATSALLFNDSFGIERYREVPIVWESKTPNSNIILKFKAKLDTIIINHNTKQIIVVDTKSTEKVTAVNYCPTSQLYNGYSEKYEGFITPFESRRVYKQLALYSKAVTEIPEIRELVYQKQYKVDTAIIAVETVNDCNVAAFYINNTWIYKGNYENHQLFNRVIWHMENNKWDYHKEEYTDAILLSPYINR